MRRPAALILLVMAAPAATFAAPENAPPPVCGQSKVLLAVKARLDLAGQPVRLEEESAGEVSARNNLVYCAIRVHTAEYDTNDRGRQPIDVVRVYNYTLELRHYVIFLRPDS